MIGAIVLIMNFGYYEGCKGIVTRIEPVPGYNTDMTVVRTVRCPNGDQYKWIAGIPSKYLAVLK